MNPINGNTLHTHTWPLMTPTVVDRHGVTEMKKHVVDLCYLNDFVLAAFDYIRFYSKRCAKHDSTIIITSITRLLGVKFRSMSYWQVTKVKQTEEKNLLLDATVHLQCLATFKSYLARETQRLHY